MLDNCTGKEGKKSKKKAFLDKKEGEKSKKKDFLDKKGNDSD